MASGPREPEDEEIHNGETENQSSIAVQIIPSSAPLESFDGEETTVGQNSQDLGLGSFEREEATNENAEEPQIASGAVEQTTEGMTAEGAADESEWTEKEDDWRPVTTTT